jgi:transcription initiation factor IIE alpha subunit
MQIAEAIGCPVDILLKDPRKEVPQQPQFELKCPSCGAPLELVNKVTALQDIDSNVDAKEL